MLLRQHGPPPPPRELAILRLEAWPPLPVFSKEGELRKNAADNPAGLNPPVRLKSVCVHECVRARALRAAKDVGDLTEGRMGSESQSSR